MSRKRKKKKKKKQRQQQQRQQRQQTVARAAEREPQRTPAEEAEFIRELLGSGATDRALKRAKALYNREESPASEALLIETSFVRVEQLIRLGRHQKAEDLIEEVSSQFPAHRDRARRYRARSAAWQGNPRELLGPLAEPNLPREQRTRVMDDLRRWVPNPGDVATCPVLKAGHPVRRAATDVFLAFDAVTSGPVTPDDVALPAVSRRSPFAPWKLLIRALDAYHRGEDDACLTALEAIAPDSTPAPLVPIIRGIIQGELPGDASPSSREIARRAAGEQVQLRRAFEAIERAFDEENDPAIMSSIRELVRIYRKSRPDQVGRLCSRLAARAYIEGYVEDVVEEAASITLRLDAYYWLQLARAAEVGGLREMQIFDILYACSMWDRFLHHALDEEWFEAGGPEEAALYYHMALLLTVPPSRVLATSRVEYLREGPLVADCYINQPPEIKALRPRQQESWFLYPEKLFARAVGIHPRATIFRRWLEWTRETSDHWRPGDEVAETWHRTLPEDPKPLLELMASAERRNALTKAMKYLEQAEALDSLNPEVHRARRRLLVATALRHLKAGKPHLVERDIATIEADGNTEAAAKDAFATALRWGCALRDQDLKRAQRLRKQLSDTLGNEVAARVYLEATLENLKVSQKLASQALPALKPRPNGEDLALGVAIAAGVADRIEYFTGIPERWTEAITLTLAEGPGSLEPRHLRSLAEDALDQDEWPLAYAAAGAGLQIPGPHLARFLLLRARSLSPYIPGRKVDCLRACVTLARQAGDSALVEEALDEHQDDAGFGLFRPLAPEGGLEPMTSEEVQQTLESERAETEYPYAPAPDMRFGSSPFDLPDEDWDEDDEDELFEEDEGDELGFDALEEFRDFSENFERLPGPIRQMFLSQLRGPLLDQGFPPELVEKMVPVILEATIKYGTPDDIPPFDELERDDPALARKLVEVAEELERFGHDGESMTGPRTKRGRKR